MRVLRRLLPLAALAAATVPVAALAYDGWVVFGDSLSDTGNQAIQYPDDRSDPSQITNTFIPTYPYPSGRYSNAEVWTASFAAAIGQPALASLAGGNVYAYGGSRTGVPNPDPGFLSPSLRDQVSGYLEATGGVADPNALYVIEGGGNNARDTLEAISGGAPLLRTLIGGAWRYASDEAAMVEQLQAAGARHIVVWNTPDIARSPAVAAEGPAAVLLAGKVVDTMNRLLDRRLAGMAGVQVFDVASFIDGIVANPAAYGLVNATDACGGSAGCDPSGYLFWDGIHPTSAGHALLAQQMMVVAGVPEPATVSMMIAGAMLLLGWRRLHAARAGAASSASISAGVV